jgi:mono/diheme cytochrome c family protein
MRRYRPIGCLFLGLLLAGTASADKPAPKPGSEGGRPGGSAGAAPKDDAVASISGSYTFRTYCASCHGTDGKGDGPLADSLRYHPPDLSLIAARNGGGFPMERIVRIVDGRDPVKGHGGPDMPVWGDAFKNADTGYDDKRVREKIRSVVDFVRTLQAK